MKRIDVVKDKSGNGWVGKSGGKVVSSGDRKTDTVRATAKVAKNDPKPVSVRIHKENGQIQEERTYPSSADPRKSKG